jgi:hypothetical protein
MGWIEMTKSVMRDKNDFITITDDGEECITSPMPPDETVVEVRLKDGSAARAWYSCNIMDAGDWDFLPMPADADEPDIEADSIADQVVAWRPLVVATATERSDG